MRLYWSHYHPTDWLFPGQKPGTHLSGRSVEKVFERVRQQARIDKPATPHTLRHCFATHQLDRGVDIYHISRFLGHESLKTTEIYLHLTSRDLARIDSPLDHLEEDDASAS